MTVNVEKSKRDVLETELSKSRGTTLNQVFDLSITVALGNWSILQLKM